MVNIKKDKKTNNERQNIIQSPLTTECKLRCSGMVDSSCSTNITRHVIAKLQGYHLKINEDNLNR